MILFPYDIFNWYMITFANHHWRYLVVDLTMGSGSTGVACKNTNRNFIGIEQDAKYFEIAKQRIEEASFE